MKIKAVVDTNVLISGIFWRGTPFEVLKAWQQGHFTLALSMPILEEYRRVLTELAATRPFTTLAPILQLIEFHSLTVEPVPFVRSVCEDSDDDKFLEAAIAAAAEYVVSGDKALLRVREHQGVKIVQPSRFLRILFT